MCVNSLLADEKQSGFTLVEVLVAVLILSIGIFGLIALETNTLKNNQSAYLRSQATILIYDMADKMRANRQVDYVGVSAVSHASSCVSYTGTATACTAETIAEKDLYDWQDKIGEILPGGLGTVSAAGSTISVQIDWDDDRSPATGTAGREQTFGVNFEL